MWTDIPEDEGFLGVMKVTLLLQEKGPYICPDAACQCKGAVLVGVYSALVQVPDVQLDAGMVLGCDELVCPRAAAN